MAVMADGSYARSGKGPKDWEDVAFQSLGPGQLWTLPRGAEVLTAEGTTCWYATTDGVGSVESVGLATEWRVHTEKPPTRE